MAKLEKERIVLHILYNTKGIVICIPLFNHEIGEFGGLFSYSQKRTDIFCYFNFEIVHRHIQISPPNPVI